MFLEFLDKHVSPVTNAWLRSDSNDRQMIVAAAGEIIREHSLPLEPVIDIRDLRKTYRDGLLGRRRVEALRGVTFQVGGGEIFGLLGPNGAGKTTLIKVLLGIVRKSGGNASLLGRSPGDRKGRKQVGYLPENHRIPAHHTGNT
ncbi:MAG: ATP-binding cassette domain-containing protein, partial [Pirellulales bacterium]